MKNRNLNHSDDWKTPDSLYKELDDEFHFDFDPCPYQSDFDGLLVNWGKMNFVNPPYSRKLKEAFILKAVREAEYGNSSVLLLPVSTSTKIFHAHIKQNEIRFIEGRVKFEKKFKDGFLPTNGGQHDSMLVIIRGLVI